MEEPRVGPTFRQKNSRNTERPNLTSNSQECNKMKFVTLQKYSMLLRVRFKTIGIMLKFIAI